MRLQIISDDEQGAGTLMSECREEFDDLMSYDAGEKHAEVKLPEGHSASGVRLPLSFGQRQQDICVPGAVQAQGLVDLQIR